MEMNVPRLEAPKNNLGYLSWVACEVGQAGKMWPAGWQPVQI